VWLCLFLAREDYDRFHLLESIIVNRNYPINFPLLCTALLHILQGDRVWEVCFLISGMKGAICCFLNITPQNWRRRIVHFECNFLIQPCHYPQSTQTIETFHFAGKVLTKQTFKIRTKHRDLQITDITADVVNYFRPITNGVNLEPQQHILWQLRPISHGLIWNHTYYIL